MTADVQWKGSVSERKEDSMSNVRKILAAMSLLVAAAVLLLLPQASSRTKQTPGMQHGASAEALPAYHSEAPKGALPATLEPSLFPDKAVFNAYAVAGRIKKVLYQEPCYCHCDRGQSHNSLLDCFASNHGSGCDICMKEAFYSYEQTHKGKTPAQIREGIVRGDWQKEDVAKYEKAYLPPASK